MFQILSNMPIVTVIILIPIFFGTTQSVQVRPIITYDNRGRHIQPCPDEQYYDMAFQTCKNCSRCEAMSVVRSCSKYSDTICALYNFQHLSPESHQSKKLPIVRIRFEETLKKTVVTGAAIEARMAGPAEMYSLIGVLVAFILMVIVILVAVLMRRRLKKSRSDHHKANRNLYVLCTPIYKPSANSRLQPTNCSRYLSPLDQHGRQDGWPNKLAAVKPHDEENSVYVYMRTENRKSMDFGYETDSMEPQDEFAS